MLTGDSFVKLQIAAMSGVGVEGSGVRNTQEARDAYKQIVKELNDAPIGTMVEVVSDWGDGDKYDDLIEATWKAHGKP